MSVLNKSRTFIPNVPGMITYHNDGKGRDTYISMDNGGFWKRPVFMSKEESTNRHVTKSSSMLKMPGIMQTTRRISNLSGVLRVILPFMNSVSRWAARVYVSVFSLISGYKITNK